MGHGDRFLGPPILSNREKVVIYAKLKFFSLKNVNLDTPLIIYTAQLKNMSKNSNPPSSLPAPLRFLQSKST